MLLATDTYYFEEKARTVAALFDDWTNAKPKDIFIETTTSTEEYQPGEFYKRELPCIISILKKIDLKGVKAVIIDGFVMLDDSGKLGLGGHLYEHLGRKIPVIGVAKTNFGLKHNLKREVLRGESEKPLYVTASGIDLDVAADYIRNMHGSHRIPTILKHVDSLTKGN